MVMHFATDFCGIYREKIEEKTILSLPGICPPQSLNKKIHFDAWLHMFDFRIFFCYVGTHAYYIFLIISVILNC